MTLADGGYAGCSAVFLTVLAYAGWGVCWNKSSQLAFDPGYPFDAFHSQMLLGLVQAEASMLKPFSWLFTIEPPLNTMLIAKLIWLAPISTELMIPPPPALPPPRLCGLRRAL